MVESIFKIAGRHGPSAVVVAAAMLALSACQSTPAAPTSPVASALEVTVEDADQPQAATPRPTSPDGYPNFAGALSAASVQMSNEEAQALQFQFASLSKARHSGTISEAEYQTKLTELRRLAAEHGAETQALIAK